MVSQNSSRLNIILAKFIKMPIHQKKDQTGYYFQWGTHGKKYYYKPLSVTSITLAYNKAKKQGAAIKISQN